MFADRVSILLVEDNEDHAYLVEKALRGLLLGGKMKLDVASDGEEALNYINKLGPFKDQPKPDLILLDIKLPKKDGFAVLKELKQDESNKQIPVVILTSSEREMDVARSYALGANSYISKPISVQSLNRKVRRMMLYWLQVSNLPRNREQRNEAN